MILSACLIVKGDELTLPRAVASVRPFVDQVVVLVTGDAVRSGLEHDVDKIAFADGCNAKVPCEGPCQCRIGDIIDFATARNQSFELASADKIMWLDADDEIAGGEHIRELAASPAQILSPYEYAFDEEGHCTDRFWLPRIVTRDKRWCYPIHEELTGIEPGVKRPDVVWKHRRTAAEGLSSAVRNLRVCLHHAADPRWKNDARFWYFVAHAYLNVGRRIKAAEIFLKALELRPEPHLRCITAQKIAQCLWVHPFELACEWAHRALSLEPNWPSCWFLLADVYEAKGRLDVAEQFARTGFTWPNEDTTWPIDPTLRSRWIFKLDGARVD